MSHLAENIKQIRLNSGLTQLEFGKKYGLSRFNVSSYEDGRAKPPVEVLITIAKEVNTSVEALFENIIETASMESEKIEVEAPEDNLLIENAPVVEPKTDYFPTSLFDEPLTHKVSPIPLDQNVALSKKTPKVVEQEEVKIPIAQKEGNFKENADTYIDIQSVALIKNSKEYELNYDNPDWLARLSHMHIPLYQKGEFRAFEDKNTWFVCKQVSNWFNVSDGVHCFVLAKGHGLLYRKLYNEIKLKGEFLLSSLKEGEPVIALGLRDAIEIWEVVVQINYGKPAVNPSFNKLEEIVEDLKLEIFRLST